MKKILKFTLLISFALTLQNQLWQNLDFSNSITVIIKVAFLLTIFELLLKPIIKLLLIPINLLTLGLFRIVINTFGFYLAVFIFNDFKVGNIHLDSFNIYGLLVPTMSFNNFWAFVVNSTSTNMLLSFFKFIIKPKKEHK